MKISLLKEKMYVNTRRNFQQNFTPFFRANKKRIGKKLKMKVYNLNRCLAQ